MSTADRLPMNVSTEELLIELVARMSDTPECRGFVAGVNSALAYLPADVLEYRPEPALGFVGKVCGADMQIPSDHPVEWLRGKATIEFACSNLPDPTVIGAQYRVTMTPEPEPEQLTLGVNDG